nr:MAG TPA: hypothetical protein [Caudoviricetes sp.]
MYVVGRGYVGYSNTSKLKSFVFSGFRKNCEWCSAFKSMPSPPQSVQTLRRYSAHNEA